MFTTKNIEEKTAKEVALFVCDLRKKLFQQEQKNQQQEQQINQQQQTITTLHQQLHQALQHRFGTRSEKMDLSDKQGLLFDEADKPNNTKEIEKAEEEITTVAAPRKKRGRKPLPKDFPRIRKVYDISNEEKTCSCGCELTRIGEEVSEQFERIPATVQVIQHVRLKYACKQCEETISTAKPPKLPIPKSIATPSLLAHVLVSKYCDHLPLYRQEKILQRYKIDIPRNTLCNWVVKCADLLLPLVKLMEDKINSYDIAYADETTLQVLKEKGRKPTTKSYMWVFSGAPPDKRCHVYRYSPTRGSEVPIKFFDDFSGYLHVDAYAAYNTLVAVKGDKVKLVACWAHARRNFVDIVKLSKANQPGLAVNAVEQIAELYKIETQVKAEKLSSEKVRQRRYEKSKPLLDAFKGWLDEHINKVPPKSPIGKAIAYCLNHWANLTRYLNDGRLEIDNNLSERTVKPFVIGRKNWMFAGNAKGAEAAATIYSLIETCKANSVEPYAYLKYVLAEIVHCETIDELEKFLPFNCTSEQLAKPWEPR